MLRPNTIFGSRANPHSNAVTLAASTIVVNPTGASINLEEEKLGGHLANEDEDYFGNVANNGGEEGGRTKAANAL